MTIIISTNDVTINRGSTVLFSQLSVAGTKYVLQFTCVHMK